MARVRHEALSRAQQEWNQPQPFKIEFTHAGLRADCLKCHGGRVVWSFVGCQRFMPTFQFKCECGNEAMRTVFNAVSGFPAEPDEKY